MWIRLYYCVSTWDFHPQPNLWVAQWIKVRTSLKSNPLWCCLQCSEKHYISLTKKDKLYHLIINNSVSLHPHPLQKWIILPNCNETMESYLSAALEAYRLSQASENRQAFQWSLLIIVLYNALNSTVASSPEKHRALSNTIDSLIGS